MVERYRSRWLRLAVLVVSVATVLILASAGALAAARCKKVDSSFTLQQ